jgi:hypothetical protein
MSFLTNSQLPSEMGEVQEPARFGTGVTVHGHSQFHDFLFESILEAGNVPV